ncbi:MAG: hypothetical protein RMM98_03530 [Acidobacteriota bacterium]|nr:hypothetical protein [Blastocatellia bacterium]MDW8238663.1 hypothetical protein [Acidobacteriota bacterium]
MPQIDFIISNDSHHVAMFLPIVRALAASGHYRCRIVSLCEFRGLVSPTGRFDMERVSLRKVLPIKIRSSPTVGQQVGGMRATGLRQLARAVSWFGLLQPNVRRCFDRAPDLVVLPNDAAFPYDHICRWLRARGIPFLLVQEGIRFPLPGAIDGDTYGQGGAAAVAAWGQTSADYFRRQGVPDERIHLTGSPRYDELLAADWQPEARRLKQQWGWDDKNLLFLSNPIDDQGFCTTPEKYDLIRRFIRAIEPLFDDPGFRLIIKLHGRESLRDVQALVAGLAYARQISVLGVGPVYPLFLLSRAAIVLASTVGLEALLFGLPLGVLEIPRVGFVYDYVARGAARGLTWSQPMLGQVRELLDGAVGDRGLIEAYVSETLVGRAGATDRVVQLIARLVDGNR